MPHQCIVLAEAHLLLFSFMSPGEKKTKTQISDSEASSLVCLLVPLQVPQRLLLPFLEQSGRIKLHSFNPFSDKNKCHCLPLLDVYLLHSYLQTQTQPPTNKESTAPSLTQALCGLWLARKEIHSYLLKLWTGSKGIPNLWWHPETSAWCFSHGCVSLFFGLSLRRKNTETLQLSQRNHILIWEPERTLRN